MKNVKPRGVKKGESPNWNVGRKSKDKDKKNINKSITLPKNIWDVLDNKAKEDTKKFGFKYLNLCTDHVGYYEKLGFELVGYVLEKEI